jgi:transketolase C-terminal domain/subunit
VAANAGLAIKMRRIGIPDCFCDSGSIPYLVSRYGMEAQHIASAALSIVA